MNIYFDIETGPLNDQELEQFKPVFEASKVLKDPEKIKADIAAKELEWKEKAALSAHLGKILAIGFIEGDETFIRCDPSTEKEMLEFFWEKFRSGEKFIGHNVKGFDVPFLIRRSYIQGVAVPHDAMDGRYVSKRFVDTMELWAAGTRDMISLDNLSKALGVGEKNGHGSEFAKLFNDPETRVKAIDYLTNDLQLLKGCAQKMGVA